MFTCLQKPLQSSSRKKSGDIRRKPPARHVLRKQILLLGNKKCFCHGVKNIYASRTQILRPKHMFPSLATPGNITRNIASATMFPSLAPGGGLIYETDGDARRLA